jgi:hypothetical protein
MDDHSCSIHIYHAGEKACLPSSASPFNRHHRSQQQHRAISPNNFNGTRPQRRRQTTPSVGDAREQYRQICWDVNFVVFYYILAYKNVNNFILIFICFFILIYSNKNCLSVCFFRGEIWSANDATGGLVIRRAAAAAATACAAVAELLLRWFEH